MAPDITPFLRQYEAVSALADETFLRVKRDHSDLVNCRVGCDSCCYALFDLTLIEALYTNRMFLQRFKGKERARRIEIANKTDRQLFRIKKKAYQDLRAGKEEAQILKEMAGIRIRCPLLNEADECDLYAYRPITCRLYGVPTAIAGVGYTCGKSGFSEGESYPTVNLDPIQKHLYEISAELVRGLKSKHEKLAELLVPLSMAILTDYNEAYLGIDPSEGEPDDVERKGK